MHGMRRSAAEFLLLLGVRLVDQHPAGPERRRDLRKQTAFEVEENHDKIERIFRKLRFGQVGLLGKDVYIQVLGLPTRLFEGHLGDVHQGDQPTAFGQANGMAPNATSEVQSATYIFGSSEEIMGELGLG